MREKRKMEKQIKITIYRGQEIFVLFENSIPHDCTLVRYYEDFLHGDNSELGEMIEQALLKLTTKKTSVFGALFDFSEEYNMMLKTEIKVDKSTLKKGVNGEFMKIKKDFDSKELFKVKREILSELNRNFEYVSTEGFFKGY